MIVEKYGIHKGVGVQRKLKGPIGCAFGGIFGMAWRTSLTMPPLRLGMGPTFFFGLMFGAETWFSSLHS